MKKYILFKEDNNLWVYSDWEFTQLFCLYNYFPKYTEKDMDEFFKIEACPLDLEDSIFSNFDIDNIESHRIILYGEDLGYDYPINYFRFYTDTCDLFLFNAKGWQHNTTMYETKVTVYRSLHNLCVDYFGMSRTKGY